jgi:hypothetical protein
MAWRESVSGMASAWRQRRKIGVAKHRNEEEKRKLKRRNNRRKWP